MSRYSMDMRHPAPSLADRPVRDLLLIVSRNCSLERLRDHIIFGHEAE